MTVYYLSGPMRGKPDYNRETFSAVEAELHDLFASETGATWAPESARTVTNPARNFGGNTSLKPSVHLTLDFKQVLESDVIVQLPGWQSSEGAVREARLALWAGKRFVKATQRDAAQVGDTEARHTWVFTNIDGPEFSESVRAGALDEAKQLITGDRNNAYGPPWQDFARAAGILTALGYRGPEGRDLASHDTAIFVTAVKLSRLMWTPAKRDSWVDIAGYAGCGLECAMHEAGAA
jgi:hypothetical protein